VFGGQKVSCVSKLGPMLSVRVDPLGRIVRVQPSLTLGELDIHFMRGALGRDPDDATPFPNRSARHNILPAG
jgi:hypothetical protein